MSDVRQRCKCHMMDGADSCDCASPDLSRTHGKRVKPIFLNEEPCRSPEADPLKALMDTLAFSADDWGNTRAKAWVWGIVLGWDDALDGVALQHGWSDGAKTRLTELHNRFTEVVEGSQ